MGRASASSGRRMKDRRKLKAKATMAVSKETPTAIIAALAMLALKASFAPAQTVRATPKNDTGGKRATRCALVIERRLSKSGTVRLVASKINRATTETKRIDSETLRKAEAGKRAVSSPASAKMAKKLKKLAAK